MWQMRNSATACDQTIRFIIFNDFSGVEATVLPHLDYFSESLPDIKKTINGYDALIWNTKHKLNTEILNIAGKLKPPF